jgi:hypothetical protein
LQIAGRDHRSIIARFGEREDEAASRLLEFARAVTGEPAKTSAP